LIDIFSEQMIKLLKLSTICIACLHIALLVITSCVPCVQHGNRVARIHLCAAVINFGVRF
jgi:hypothetical protein